MRGLLALGVMVLVGCASTNVQQYTSIDTTAKTITVPPGGSGLTGKIKGALSQAGWQMVVYRGPAVTRGTVGSEVRLATGDTFNSRYNLLVDWVQFDYCLNLQPMIRYDISMIDNQSGAEVITMDGTGCETAVANNFAERLK